MKALSRVPCNNSDPDCFLKTAIKEGPPAVSAAEYKTLRPIWFNCARSCSEYCIYFHTTLFMHDGQIRFARFTLITSRPLCLLLHFFHNHANCQICWSTIFVRSVMVNNYCVFNIPLCRTINYMQTTFWLLVYFSLSIAKKDVLLLF